MSDERVSVEADFCAFVEGRQRSLRHTAWLLTGDLGLAEDLVQVALMKSWPHWHKLVGIGSPEAYVRRAMVSTYSSWWRRQWRGEVPADVPETASDTADLSLQTSVRSALQSLPLRQRAAVVLRYFEDLTEEQTAELLGCSIGTVKSQTSRALDKLRAYPGLSDLLVEGAEP